VAIPGSLFACELFPQLFNTDDQGGDRAGLQQENYKRNGNHRPKIRSGSLLIGRKICIQQVDGDHDHSNAKQEPFVLQNCLAT
jgi:hypothetical protein